MFSIGWEDEGRIVMVRLDRPPANAINSEGVAALDGVLDQIEDDPSARVVLFYAQGRFFSAGADIRGMSEALGSSDGPERLAALAKAMQDAFRRVAALPLPTVCALSGIATGGGFELALACDLRVAEPDVLLGLPEARIGLIPGAGGTQVLTAIAGPSIARRLILTGELISGTRAAELGLLHDLAKPGAGLSVALGLARAMAAVPRRTQVALKRCLLLASSPEGFAAEIEETLALQRTAETQDLIRAFLERSTRRHQSSPSSAQ